MIYHILIVVQIDITKVKVSSAHKLDTTIQKRYTVEHHHFDPFITYLPSDIITSLLFYNSTNYAN